MIAPRTGPVHGDPDRLQQVVWNQLKDRLDALAAGFQMHVSKPVEPAELIAVVANLARSRPVRSASE